MSDPNRLRDGADATELALLDALRTDAPSDELRVGMWSAIAAQAGAATLASTASAASAKGVATKVSAAVATKAVAAKVAVVVALGAVGAGTAWVQSRRVEPVATPPAHVAAPPVHAAPAQAAAPVEREAQQVASRLLADALAGPLRFRADGELCKEGDDARIATGCAVSGDALEVLAPVQPQKRVKKRVLAPVIDLAPVRAAPSLDALQAESQLLAHARARLRANDLAGTEQALSQARDRFPHGSLGQEREVLQIELLAALGDGEGADHRARRFLRKHPDSPHAKSVQRYLIAP